jgi:hypothetical protein
MPGVETVKGLDLSIVIETRRNKGFLNFFKNKHNYFWQH